MEYPGIVNYNAVLGREPNQRPLRHPRLSGVNAGEILPGKRSLHRGSGAVAVVYRCREAGGHEVALRCFHRSLPIESAELAARYQAFTRHAAKAQLPCLIRAEHLPDAIEINGNLFPVFLMDWVEGKMLHVRVRELADAGDRTKLRRLADQWQRLVKDLRQNHIAHGDLADGNVMVTANHELRLVDYDSVYVPSLAGRDALVAGTPGYVLPRYLEGTPRPYNEHVDTFGALVILLSLRALAAEPSLYGRFTQDALLIPPEDLANPASHSKIQAELKHCEDRNVLGWLSAVLTACRTGVESNLAFPYPYE